MLKRVVVHAKCMKFQKFRKLGRDDDTQGPYYHSCNKDQRLLMLFLGTVLTCLPSMGIVSHWFWHDTVGLGVQSESEYVGIMSQLGWMIPVRG